MGQTQQSRAEKATEFRGGTVHLLSSSNEISDTDTTITSDASLSTADADWSITHDNQNGTTTLENSNPLKFGAVSGFTISQVVIESTTTSGNFIREVDPTGDTNLSGDGESVIETGKISYTFG